MSNSNSIVYTQGDATKPISSGNKVIVHICNDIGGWGRGFVVAISNRWKEPEQSYRNWYSSQDGFELGAVQFVKVEDDLWVANMIAQHKTRLGKDGSIPLRVEALSGCLAKVKDFALKYECSVHMPRIGCGLAGGKWEDIEPRILHEITSHGIETTVYDFA